MITKECLGVWVWKWVIRKTLIKISLKDLKININFVINILIDLYRY